MAHATGTRLLAALCVLSVVLSPLGVVLWWIARKKEKARENELERLENIQENTSS